MNRIIMVFIALFTLGQVASAQNEVRSMNDIKNDLNYIYATGTSIVSYEEASQNAKDLLKAEIEDWLKNNGQLEIAGFVAKFQEQLGQIKTKRGNLHRVFAYVNKSDILSYYKDQSVLTGAVNETKEVAATDTQKNKQVKAEPEPAPDEEPAYVPSAKEKELLKIKSFEKLNEYINAGRENGSIVKSGKYATLPKEGLVYVFIYNREGEVPACMKVNSGDIINLSTCKKDEISNYKGCGAIWIKFK